MYCEGNDRSEDCVRVVKEIFRTGFWGQELFWDRKEDLERSMKQWLLGVRQV